MKALGVHHVSINVADVAEAYDFYTRVIGMTARADRPNFTFDGAWLDVGGQQVHLIRADVPSDLGQHFALQVADLDEVVAELRGLGVKVTDPKAVAANRQAFLHDPSGNQVELQQVGAKASAS